MSDSYDPKAKVEVALLRALKFLEADLTNVEIRNLAAAVESLTKALETLTYMESNS